LLLFINSYAQKTHKLTYTKKSFIRESTIIQEDGQPKIDLKIDWFNSNNDIADSINKKIFNHIADFTCYEGYGDNQKIGNYEEMVDFYIEDIYRVAFEGEEGYARSELELSTAVYYQTCDLLNVVLIYSGYIGGQHTVFTEIFLYFSTRKQAKKFL